MQPESPFHLHMDPLSSFSSSSSSSSYNLEDFEFSLPSPSPTSPLPTPSEPCAIADELFYKGQLLPLLLPSRLQMVQHLSNPTDCLQQESAVAYTKVSTSMAAASELYQDQDFSKLINAECEEIYAEGAAMRMSDASSCDLYIGESKSLLSSSSYMSMEDPSIFPNCYKDPALLCSPRITNGGSKRSGTSNPAKTTFNMVPQRGSSSSSSSSSPSSSIRWRVLFTRKSRKCKAEAESCHYTRSRSSKNALVHKEIRKERESKSFSSAPPPFSRTGSCKGSSIARSSSKKTSLCSISANSRKDRLVTKARDCLQKSLRILRLVRFQERSRGADHRTSLCKHMPISMDCSTESTETLLEDSDMGQDQSMVKSMDLTHHINAKYSESDIDTEFNFSSLSSKMDNGINTSCGFITIDPCLGCVSADVYDEDDFTTEGKIRSACRPASAINMNIDSPNCMDNNIKSFSSRSTLIDLQNSIQGAIAHCKKSQLAGA